jgi:endo-1,4-beta-xylanase
MKQRIAASIFLLVSFLSASLEAQIANDKCKFLGNVIEGSVPANFATYWNQVTPENSGKWGSVEATRDDPQWAGLDVAYNYAKNNSFPFKQHTFVWGQQQPSWMSGLSIEEQRAEVEEWIQQFCERYPNTDFIDVVNEPLHAPPGYAQALGGNGTTGWDWVIWAFEKAREYCPNAKLILNDYSIINDNNATNNYLTIVNLLKTRGLIDGIGEQGHFFETTPLATLTANLDKLHATKIPIYISEYDVNLLDDTQQKNKYEEQFPAFWEHPGVRGITLWGYRQGAIWRENAYLVRSNNTLRPAMTWLQSYVPSVSGGVFCQNVTSTEEFDFGLKVSPNPVTNGILSLSIDAGQYDLRLINSLGQVLKQDFVRGGNSVPVSISVRPGVYILQLSDGSRTVNKKIVLQ